MCRRDVMRKRGRSACINQNIFDGCVAGIAGILHGMIWNFLRVMALIDCSLY